MDCNYDQTSFFRYLDTNGDGTGTKEVKGDYSVTADEFKIVPTSTEKFSIERILVHIEVPQGTALRADYYGPIAGLPNGISIKYVKNGVTYDLTDGIPVTSHGAYGANCYDIMETSFGTGSNFVQVRWTFGKSGCPIILDGSKGDYLFVEANDDFTSANLLSHTFKVDGVKSNIAGVTAQ